MKKRKTRVILLLMVLTLGLTSCGRPSETDYQQKFAEFEETFFKEKVSDSFLDLHYALKDSEKYGIENVPEDFGQYSEEGMKEKIRYLKEKKEELSQFPFEKLNEEQQVTAHILENMIEVECNSEGLELYKEPLSEAVGIQAELPVLLAEYEFYSREDVEGYLNLLGSIDEYYVQILEFERDKADAGLFMSDMAADSVIQSCKSYMDENGSSFLLESFKNRLEQVPGLTEEEKQNLVSRNETIIKEDFLNAYQTLSDGLEKLKGSGQNVNGGCGWEKGQEYYEYLIESEIAPSYPDIGSLLEALEKMVTSKMNEMNEMVDENPKLMDEWDSAEIQYENPVEILQQLQNEIMADFPKLENMDYEIKYVPEELEDVQPLAFYVSPQIDSYHDNVIYINRKYEGNGNLYITLAHEGLPGHMYQTTYFLRNNESDLRKILDYTGYTEGWATYVEHLAYQFDNGLEPAVGKIMADNSIANLGVGAILDIKVNYYGMDREEAVDYFSDYLDAGAVNQMFDYVCKNPAVYLPYVVGYMEIEEMREEAEAKLGENFDAKKFHKFILDMGPAPFSIIREEFAQWVSD
ncbi:DUF885 domain-containing protein [Faecalicatena sp. AGMB00832]|uniref:DUF885 domain-containing protein n=1 Tax=Faecalicatena faecalis TaxID=2726362 RepID=A0ABS6D435_9FIRM|nr:MULTISPECIES: DUF885 domain-containing protein [Faecalicatena]MBU3876358.1 DUF885 domain-containing protein [Faecalicatena faecalis]MCI6464348.1 DUF885 domain-containing protein [Faecalicatena sp.]MDY5621323.1 DUF885 domain-containing protein [Lachnospiraceae bacterium]